MSDYRNPNGNQSINDAENPVQARYVTRRVIEEPINAQPSQAQYGEQPTSQRVRNRRSARPHTADDEVADVSPSMSAPVSDQTAVYGRQVASSFEPRQVADKAPRQSNFTLNNNAGSQMPVRKPVDAPGYSRARPMPTGTPPAPQRNANYENGNGNMQRVYARAPEFVDYDEYDDYSGNKGQATKRKSRPFLTVVVILLLIVAAAVVALMLWPQGDEGIIGAVNGFKQSITSSIDNMRNVVAPETKPAAEATDFTVSAGVVQIPCELVFNLTTNKSVTGVRIADMDGVPLDNVEISMRNNDAAIIWTLTVDPKEAYSGDLEAYIQEDGKWTSTGKYVSVDISAPAEVDQLITLPAEGAPTDNTDMNTSDDPDEMQFEDNPSDFDFDAQNGEDPASMILGSANLDTQTDPNASLLTASAMQSPPDADLAIDDPINDDLGPDDMDDAFDDMDTDTDTDDNGDMLWTNADDADIDQDPTDPIDPDDDAVDAVDAVVADSDPDAPDTVDQPSQEQEAQAPQTTPMPYFTATASANTDPAKLKLTEAAYLDGKKMTEYTREDGEKIQMQSPDLYANLQFGVLAFRNGPFHQNAAFGTAELANKSMDILWTVDVGGLDSYHGIGWTGQPVIVKWPKELREIMNIKDDKKASSALKEVIVSSQDGNVYFLDLQDGSATRDPINIGFPLKASLSVNPDAVKPMLSVGQAYSKVKGKTGEGSTYLFNLFDQKKLMTIGGKNDKAYYGNTVFDGSAVFDRMSDNMILAGDNGLLYTIKLNTSASIPNSPLTIKPVTSFYASKTAKQSKQQVGSESSVAVYGQYAYYGDTYGIVRCVDMNTMSCVWAVDTGDNTDAAIALEVEDNGSVALYTANTLTNRQGKKGVCTVRRLDALTGEEKWKYEVTCKYDSKITAGAMASPIVGQNNISNMVIFTIAKTEAGGAVIAFDKQTGNVIWQQDMTNYSWSSPVAVYDEGGNACIIQGDSEGVMQLMDGQTGDVLSSLQLEGAIEASPAVYNNVLVIGTSAKGKSHIYGIELK